MILIGMFDSPYVRRVAISMKLLEIPFQHRNWSVGRELDQIKRHNPLGRVPTLVLDDGENLIESGAILDYLDERAGPARALLPPSGPERRRALKLMALATGAADKAVAQMAERIFRPEDKRHGPWRERCHAQMQGALAELSRLCALKLEPYLLGHKLTQADITVSCAVTYIADAVGLPSSEHAALRRHVERCETLPEFAATRVPFFAPRV